MITLLAVSGMLKCRKGTRFINEKLHWAAIYAPVQFCQTGSQIFEETNRLNRKVAAKICEERKK
jgi:hypothetical protein